ncbi:hypothetical protein SSBR45G_31730 [Bradyrhizobium sp. SSBR45G]|uniref:hypothetical protein n=1 Tax=unclassified Bradyrhizobium TaxID=2631580 RepID=UPI0023428C65|nr:MULTISPECIES: hypothetical protein [unclassified Bradyrhizobium]GLH78264.1 hypothetical protein SSBR45G_31730 [Bradyrhizobium sp. SSBR45G]GLH85969.1 hypothetical protein SSBR45R_34290 [Bradyrhizobium sp. SSBR45R]
MAKLCSVTEIAHHLSDARRSTPRRLIRQAPTTSYVLAWVPRPLTPMVDEGIRAIPEECVEWIDERRPHLIEALAARGRQAGDVMCRSAMNNHVRPPS